MSSKTLCSVKHLFSCLNHITFLAESRFLHSDQFKVLFSAVLTELYSNTIIYSASATSTSCNFSTYSNSFSCCNIRE